MVSICGPERLAACLAALDRQRDPPSFEIVVACDEARADREPLRSLRERVVRVAGPPSPPLLAAAAVRASRGGVVLLTEDHCVPGPDWVRRLRAAAAGSPAGAPGAVGGPVALAPSCRGDLEWAFHFSDFAPYVPPVEAGPRRSLSVCNAAYPRATLERLRPVWLEAFHETRVHAAIRRDVGPLVMVPDAPVVSGRRIRLADAVRERYGLGRLYGAVRFADASGPRRALRALAAPGLPPLLLARLALRARRTPEASRRLARAFLHLSALVLAWSCGETAGLLTARAPLGVRMAPEPAPGPVEEDRRS